MTKGNNNANANKNDNKRQFKDRGPMTIKF